MVSPKIFQIKKDLWVHPKIIYSFRPAFGFVLILSTLARFFLESEIILIVLDIYGRSIYIAYSLSQYGNPEGDIRSSYQSLLSKALSF